MRQTYQTVDRKDSRALAQFLSREGQALLPMLDLIEQAEMAVDELIDVAGRAMAVPEVSGRGPAPRPCRPRAGPRARPFPLTCGRWPIMWAGTW